MMTDLLKPYIDKIQTSEGREYLRNLMSGNQWKNSLNEVGTYDYDLNKYAQSKGYKDIYEYAGNVSGGVILAVLTTKGLNKLFASTTGGGTNTGNNPTPHFEGASEVKVTANDIKFSDKFSIQNYKTQVKDRGWTNQKIADAINKPYKVIDSVNKFNGNPAKVYFINDTHYVVIDSVTNKVVQISDLADDFWKFTPGNFIK